MAEEKNTVAASVTTPETAAKRAKTAETIATGIAGILLFKKMSKK